MPYESIEPCSKSKIHNESRYYCLKTFSCFIILEIIVTPQLFWTMLEKTKIIWKWRNNGITQNIAIHKLNHHHYIIISIFLLCCPKYIKNWIVWDFTLLVSYQVSLLHSHESWKKTQGKELYHSCHSRPHELHVCTDSRCLSSATGAVWR